MGHNSVAIGHSRVLYTSKSHLNQYQDVKVLSATGKSYTFNSCVLAAASPLCHEAFMTHNNRFSAAGDICISTNLSDKELTVFGTFVLEGMLPCMPDCTSLDLDMSPLFKAFGLDLPTVTQLGCEGIKNLIVDQQDKAGFF